MFGKLTNTVIVVAGPTAVGKTAVAIELAEHFRAEIISADSRQCFREMNIGVARPSPAELQKVKHHFVASHSIKDEVNAAVFEKYALEKTRELLDKSGVVIMAGGTGLYIKAFCEGLDDVPSVDPEIRENIIATYGQKGLEWLQQEIRQKDPEFYRTGEMQNPQRMMRALEVIESTGRSILHFRKGRKAHRDFDIIKIGLGLPRETLNLNISARVDKMIAQGLVQEVKGLRPYQHFNALQTVGYSEIFDYLDGKISLEEAVRNIKTNTRQYAKRQMTWFRKDKSIKWFSPLETAKIIEYVQSSGPLENS
jgi:tRNA dimethylallyltransferase